MKTAHIDFNDCLSDIVLPDGITLLGWRMVIDESDGDQYDIDGTIACVLGDEPFKVVTNRTESKSVPVTSDILDRLEYFVGDDQYNIIANHVVFVAAYGHLGALGFDLIDDCNAMHKSNQEIIDGMVLRRDQSDIEWLSVDGIGVVIDLHPERVFVEMRGELYDKHNTDYEDTPCNGCGGNCGICFYSRDPTHFEFKGKIYKYPEQ
jgi:hypothetical protein